MNAIYKKQLFISFLSALIFFGGVFFAPTIYAQAQVESFSVEQLYDLYGRKKIETTLVRQSRQLYFYAETKWWNSLSDSEQNTAKIALFELGSEFENTIYPVLTSTFGAEPSPGVDRDSRITIVIHEMAQEAGGYFNSGDVYSRLQNPRSNEREMLYLNSYYITKPEAKSFLAHEFLHIITANQKDLTRKVTEETWLNEARAEYAPTLLGYDDIYEGSNLQRRVQHFLAKPSDPLTEWLNRKEDYGAVNLFIQYMVDHYGVGILVDSLQSSRVGIASLDQALRQNGFQETFTDIFTNWAIASLVNDCQLGEHYCYKNRDLKGLRITPAFYYLPGGESVFATHHSTAYWSANWHRLVGGGQDVALEFDGASTADFNVPYVLCKEQDSCSVGFFLLDEEQKGAATFSEFDTTYNSLTIIPFVKSNGLGENGARDSFNYSWQITGERNLVAQAEEEAVLVNQLLSRITELQEQVRQLQVHLAALNSDSFVENRAQSEAASISCASLNVNLSFGMRNEQVRCLQEFLKGQGSDIYPEGLITGNFLSLTKQAVIRFQEKYASEILTPVGESRGTGYVGQITRNKINQTI